MPLQGLLGEDQFAVEAHLKDPATGGDHLHLGIGELAAQLGGQTGSPGLVVSDDAVLNGDMHGAGPA